MFVCQQLSKHYGNNLILDQVSFQVSRGQCLGICGENGSGKSTLLRLLAQIEPPDSGTLLWDGKPVLGDKAFLRTRLGYVPQNPDLQQDLTVQQQLRLWQSACGCSGSIPEDIADLLGLTPLMNQRIHRLSGGTQRRVSIGMALLTRPELLIMDEATAGLDQAYCLRLLDWLETYVKNGGCLIWCSHREEEVERLCGFCLHLHPRPNDERKP